MFKVHELETPRGHRPIGEFAIGRSAALAVLNSYGKGLAITGPTPDLERATGLFRDLLDPWGYGVTLVVNTVEDGLPPVRLLIYYKY
jgi:hypothetical protein